MNKLMIYKELFNAKVRSFIETVSYTKHSGLRSFDTSEKENCGTCGTCNGACCDTCRKIISVESYSPFPNWTDEDYSTTIETAKIDREMYRPLLNKIMSLDEQNYIVKEVHPGSAARGDFSSLSVVSALLSYCNDDDGVRAFNKDRYNQYLFNKINS